MCCGREWSLLPVYTSALFAFTSVSHQAPLTHGELWQTSATTLQGAVGQLSSLQNLLFPFPGICSVDLRCSCVSYYIVVYSALPNQTGNKENLIHKRCDKRLHTTHLLSAGKSGAHYRSFSVLYLFMWYFPPFASCLLNQRKMWKCSCDLMLDVFAFH